MSYNSPLAHNGFMGGGITPSNDPFQQIQYNNSYKHKPKKSVSPDKKMLEGFKLQSDILYENQQSLKLPNIQNVGGPKEVHLPQIV